jgi:hypothetical protein
MRAAVNRSLTFAAIAMTLAVSSPAAAQTAPPPTPIVYVLEQIQSGPIAPEVMERMKATHTLQEVENLLKVNRIAFAWRMTEVSTDQMKGTLAQQIAALPPKEVFVIRQGDTWLMSSVIARR